MRPEEIAEADNKWVEILEDEYTQPELLAAIVSADEVRHQKSVSRGMAAMMGAATVLMVESIKIQDSEVIISWASNPQFMIGAYTVYLSGAVSASSRVKAAIVERRAGSAYKNVKLDTGYKPGKLVKLLEAMYESTAKVDKEI